jgi:hypothetical protein
MTQVSTGAMQDTVQVQRTVRGRFKRGHSGNPSGKGLSRRYLALFADLANDFGGESSLGALDRALLSQACTLMVRSERAKKTDDIVRLTNAAMRLLAGLRKKHQRQPTPGPTLAQYLAAKKAPAAAQPDTPDDDDEAVA